MCQSTVPNSTVSYSTVQYSTVQYSTVQYSTVQYSTVQYSTVQYSTVHLCNKVSAAVKDTVSRMYARMCTCLFIIDANIICHQNYYKVHNHQEELLLYKVHNHHHFLRHHTVSNGTVSVIYYNIINIT